jgi:hypothetical protein
MYVVAVRHGRNEEKSDDDTGTEARRRDKPNAATHTHKAGKVPKAGKVLCVAGVVERPSQSSWWGDDATGRGRPDRLVSLLMPYMERYLATRLDMEVDSAGRVLLLEGER